MYATSQPAPEPTSDVLCDSGKFAMLVVDFDFGDGAAFRFMIASTV